MTAPTAAKKRRRLPLPPVALLTVTAVVLGLSGVLWRRAVARENTIALADEPKAVTVVEATATTFRASRRYVGTLLPWLEARLGPQLTSGMVESVLVRPGDKVKRGQVLATLDCRNATAANQVISGQAQALKARQAALSREAERTGSLIDGGFVSLNEVEQKQASALSNEAQLSALLAQQQGKTLEVNDCVLRAPFDGEVAARYADPGTFARPGSSVVAVVDRSTVRLAFDVPEADYGAVSTGTPLKLKLTAVDKTFTAEVTRLSPQADALTRTLHVEADLPNGRRDFPTGTTAEVSLEIGEPRPALEVPLMAARVRGTTATVFVVENDAAVRHELKVLGEVGKSLFVEPTIPAGARVVTLGRSQLNPKDRVMARLETGAPTDGATP